MTMFDATPMPRNAFVNVTILQARQETASVGLFDRFLRSKFPSLQSYLNWDRERRMLTEL
jgi:hypothetical protein